MDWPQLLRDHGIPFDERGTSVKRGNINIRCPFCREGESRLMGLELGTSRWACWKNAKHRGANAAYLIRVLLNCSPERARELAGIRTAPEVDELWQMFMASGKPEPARAPLSAYELPRECFRLRADGHRARPFLDYLRKRSLGAACVDRYELHGAARGKSWAGRVIIPIYSRGRVVGITGRATSKRAELRYYTQPSGVGTQALIFEQLATGGRVLVIVEGPFDAMALDWAAHQAGLPVHAIALGGLAMTSAKQAALDRVCRRYERVVVLLDASATHRAMELQRSLAVEAELGLLPNGVDDAGDLKPAAAIALMRPWVDAAA